VIAPEAGDLVLIASRTLGLDTGQVLPLAERIKQATMRTRPKTRLVRLPVPAGLADVTGCTVSSIASAACSASTASSRAAAPRKPPETRSSRTGRAFHGKRSRPR
jgi:hypothetical protein